MLGLAFVVLLFGFGAAQCVNFTLPSVWPASALAPVPPYARIYVRGGSTLDSVSLVTPGSPTSTNNLTTRLGGAGGPNYVSFSYCPPGTQIIGFGWSTESVAQYTAYGMFSALHAVGPFRCSDGSTNSTVLVAMMAGGGIASTYTLPANLCGGTAGSQTPTPTYSPTATISPTVFPSGGPSACTPFRLPPIWNTTAPLPPYVRFTAKGGGTLDQVAIVNSSATIVLGGIGGVALLPTSVFCSSGAKIVGFAWKTDSSGTPVAQTYPFPGFSGVFSVGPFACSDGTTNFTTYTGTGSGGTYPSITYSLPAYLCGWSTSPSPSPSPSSSISPTPSKSTGPSPSITATQTATGTQTESQGSSASNTGAGTVSPSHSATATSSGSAAETKSASSSPTSVPTSSSTVSPSYASPSGTPAPTSSSTASLTVGAQPSTSATTSLAPGLSPSATATDTSTATASQQAGVPPISLAASPTVSISIGAPSSASPSASCTLALTVSSSSVEVPVAANAGGGVTVVIAGTTVGVLALAVAVAAILIFRRRRARAGALTNTMPGLDSNASGDSLKSIHSPLAAQRENLAVSFRVPQADASAKDMAAFGSRKFAPAASATRPNSAASSPDVHMGRSQASEGLPPDWEAVYSRSKNTYYYRHKSTQETSWVKPTAGASAVPFISADVDTAGLPSGWTAVWSKSRSVWYWRSDTGETTWNKPEV